MSAISQVGKDWYFEFQGKRYGPFKSYEWALEEYNKCVDSWIDRAQCPTCED